MKINSPFSIIYQELPPSPIQRKYILKYYNVLGETSEKQVYLEKTIPNGYTSLVFHLGEKITVSNVKYNGYDLPQNYLFGKYTNLIKVKHSYGKVDSFGVIFQPGAFRHIIKENQRIFTDKVTEVNDVFGIKFRSYLHQLEDSADYFPGLRPEKLLAYRKKIMENFFQKRFQFIDPKEDLVDEILMMILQNPQGIGLHKICHQYRISQQHLNRIFNKEIGMSVYKYARIVRLNHLIKSFDQMKEESLLQLVVDFDYHDIPHLVKDFRRFTGESPSKFLKSDNKLARFLMHC